MKLISPYAIVCKNVSSIPISTISPTQLCSCDFRINIYNCPESITLIISNWVLFSYCGLLSITAATSLWHLIKRKDQAFFLPSRRDRGKIRPRPQHIYFTMSLTYCPFQMIHSILLLTNSYPNIFWAEFGHTLPTALTATVAVLYPLSIVYSISAFEVGTNFASTRPVSMSSVLSEVPVTRQAIKADLTCIFAFILTFCLFLTVAALTGYYADITDYTNANKFFLIQNLVWAIWGFFYIVIMIWFWFRFINIVLENINELTTQTQNSELQNKLEQLRKGTRNLSLPVYGQAITIIIYIPTLILYGLYHRSNTIFNYKINLLYMFIWYFVFPLIINVTQWFMIYNIITTPSNNSGRNSISRNINKNSRNDSESTTNVKTLNENINDKRFSGNSVNNRTGFESEIIIEETYNGYPKRETSIRYSDQYTSNLNNGENFNSNNGILIKNDNNNIIKNLDSLNPNGRRESYGYYSQTMFSDSSTLITSGSSSNTRPISPFTYSTPASPRFPSSIPSSPTSPYNSIPMVPIHRNSVTSQRESINSIISNESHNSTNSSSNQRREWLIRRPAPALNRPVYKDRDNYKGKNSL
ncbi:hypothetical protein C1645_877949 [Glomus cerebriforme]|uniref:Uncharacterized protein n=1 Tax=Glomus cerebriforme TaxID=658196 RepID=A0A397SRQ7_9GLOM|nr:hypothetical protein C1645_877949 [Glomus cerebriforme]